MFSEIRTICLCLKGPNLYRIYSGSSFSGRPYEGDQAAFSGYRYEPGKIESLSGVLFALMHEFVRYGIYTSPITLLYFYVKGNLNMESLPYFKKCGLIFTCFYLLAYLTRGLCRYYQKDYKNFIKVLHACKLENSVQARKIKNFDFDFKAWPADFSKSELEMRQKYYPHRIENENFLAKIYNIPYNSLGYVLVNSFGRKMLYPGHFWILSNYLMGPYLEKGRADMILKRQGERFKIQTCDNVELDAMFIDQRLEKGEKGGFLVICCEGNAGFYEIGIMESPLQAGYSVLGWNTPGFAGSSGYPDPEVIANSIDAVIQFGLSRGFPIEKFILYGWSIGGFPVSWAAVNYPQVYSVVLDATFDDIVPLATTRFHSALEGFITKVIRNYLNLNVGDHLIQYNGPLVLVRRLQDEIIALENGVVGSNMINSLCSRIIQSRFPVLMASDVSQAALDEYLQSDEPLDALRGVDMIEMEKLYHSLVRDEPNFFPSALGKNLEDVQKKQITLYLASQYLHNLDATHCTPLPGSLFDKLVQLSRNLVPSNRQEVKEAFDNQDLVGSYVNADEMTKLLHLKSS